MDKFTSVRQVVRALRPRSSLTVFHRDAVHRAAGWFVENFPGQVLYAVKTNPDPYVLTAIHQAGVRRFDVASLNEIEAVASLFPDADACFMHTVKAPEHIAEAYDRYGIRTFAFDTDAELDKILRATGGARDLTLFVRVSVSNSDADIDLSRKFGADPDAVCRLLIRARQVAARLGICFHVGSQCMEPSSFRHAIDMVHAAIVEAGVIVDIVDVGGGFPTAYPGKRPPPLASYVEVIARAVERLPIANACELWCEPGRAIAAEASSTLIRVEARRGDALYVNDGTYGALFDAGAPGLVFPTVAHGVGRRLSGAPAPFKFFGPTCDGLDVMKGPFMLPADIDQGDYILVGKTGAYGNALRTRFNGFYSDLAVEVAEGPMMTMYADALGSGAVARKRWGTES